MKSHSFIGKDITKPCAFVFDLVPLNEKHPCNRSFIEHGPNAECEACDYKGADLELHLNSNMLLCESCIEKQVEALVEVIDAKVETAQELAQTHIRYTSDFYNAKVTSIMDLKNIIETDPNVTDKQYAFQDALALRLKHLSEVIFDADRRKYEATIEQTIINKTMRDFGEELRKEIRERIRVQDTNYVPPTPRIVQKPKLKKKDPMEILIETLAAQKKISYTEAKLMIEKGMGSVKKVE